MKPSAPGPLLLAALAALSGRGGVLPCAASLLRQGTGGQPHGGKAGGNLTAESERLPQKPANGTTQRVRLDVGFSDFEKKTLAQVGARIRGSTAGKEWTEELREHCASNVSAELSLGLKSQLAPLKQSIGKTWMALPKDEQKNAYVEQLRAAFLPVLDSYGNTIESHLNISLRRMREYGRPPLKLRHQELLGRCQALLTDCLVGEHCYEDSPKRNGTARLANASARAATQSVAMAQTGDDAVREASQFCIPSVVQGLAHRLNDTQGLISMSMRFDAGAMALAQKGARKPAAK